MNHKLFINFSGQELQGWLKEFLINNYNRYVNFNKHTNGNISNLITVESNNNNFFANAFSYHEVEGINKNKNSIVFIECNTEGIHCEKFFKQYEKSNFYVIFTNCVWNKEKYNLGIDYVNLNFYIFLKDTALNNCNLYNENYYYQKEYVFDYPKNNIFINITGTERKERSYLTDKLLDKINYNNFVLKYHGKNFGKNLDTYDMCSISINNEKFNPYKNIFVENLSIPSFIPTELYNQAYFNLVVESDIDYPYSFFPTEKIFKPLITGIPFVVYSTPRFLQNLRSLGFKTYNELWNEDYDTEFDYTKRADMIIDLCNKLEHFDWQKNKEKLQQIANHNAALMLKNSNILLPQIKNIHKTLDTIKDKDAQYLKNNPQLFEWLDNNTV